MKEEGDIIQVFFCFHLRVLGCVFVVAYAFVVAMFKHKQRSRASDKCWKCVGKVWRDQEMVCLAPPPFSTLLLLQHV